MSLQQQKIRGKVFLTKGQCFILWGEESNANVALLTLGSGPDSHFGERKSTRKTRRRVQNAQHEHEHGFGLIYLPLRTQVLIVPTSTTYSPLNTAYRRKSTRKTRRWVQDVQHEQEHGFGLVCLPLRIQVLIVPTSTIYSPLNTTYRQVLLTAEHTFTAIFVL